MQTITATRVGQPFLEPGSLQSAYMHHLTESPRLLSEGSAVKDRRFTDSETEAQRVRIIARPHSQQAAELAPSSVLPDSRARTLNLCSWLLPSWAKQGST